ncbi:polysaccharide export protein Wza [Halomonas sp. ZH2S]|uniref:Polysaccharide export protein Wza n=2 Tax=Vreelandella zhuhanensis TaxID=2684210 RepID=A0A7X3KRX1_9GAMM|nr:polysaccharide export protein Wza [Halomonas zhuhanensis]
MHSFSSSSRPLLVALLLAGLLSGCALAPGGHIESNSRAAPLDDLVDIEPITPGLVASYRHSQSAAQPMSSELRAELEAYKYRVGPGDVLNVTVYDHPELTIPAGGERSAEEAGNQVDNDGTLFYPFIGRVKVGGMTLEEVRSMLARRLVAFIAEPQVDVGVAAFRSQKVYVSGAVEEPGTLPVTNVPLTLRDAISQVGGAQEDANWHELILTRDGKEQRLSLYALMRQGDQRHNLLLRDGDMLHVPSAENQGVAVMGQVRTPGNLPVGNERISLTDAIARAGGIDEATAEPTGIFVVRTNQESTDPLATVYQLDVSNAIAFALGNQFPLQPQDVVYVTTAPLARWNRVISLLLPSVRLPGTAADTGTDFKSL